ncbi:hypothetical protein ACJMK2_039054 [Sinanodonta woodiana]|uniref:L-Fucosyltransferase n=1 Tax=Sinanodonta woodiana TaxID=1069815 RepID=A0ABD3WER4_SINWO
MLENSQYPTMHQTSMKFRTRGKLLLEKIRSINSPSRIALQFSKYTTTTGTIAEMEYNLTQSTIIPKLTLKMQNSSTYKLGLYTRKNTARNVIKNYPKDNFMTISFMGRLGNVLFQLAALLSCAKRLNVSVSVPANELIDSYFRVPRTSNVNVTNSKTFYEEMYAKYDSNIELLDTSVNWTLSGYFQSWKYFYKEDDLIRRSFEFMPKVYEPAAQFVEIFTLENKTIVGVHVRRGDMVSDFLATMGYTTAPVSYLHKAMNYFGEMYSNIVFIIVSDEISWCKENIRIHYDTTFSKFDDPWVDMAILSLCDHVIITSGTFGWWGAWLAGGDVIYYKGYPKPGSEIDEGMSREDYYPPQWIGMD